MEYEKLLERAYSRIPERMTKAERFEIPLVDILIQGPRTVIRNFEFIATTLRRKPDDLLRFMIKELAVPGSIDGPRAVLHRKFNDKQLNDRVKSFTETYVLCKECHKPDTKLVEVSRGVHMMICEACGARSPVRGG